MFGFILCRCCGVCALLYLCVSALLLCRRVVERRTDPVDTVDGGGKSLHGLTEGVRVTTTTSTTTTSKSNQTKKKKKKTLFVRSLDAGVVRFGQPFPTPTPIFNAPNMSGEGMSFGLFMNTWNTNYAYWWPYVGSPGSTSPTTASIKYRCAMEMS
jgi:hypothetical protein